MGTFDQAPAFFYNKNKAAQAEFWADAGYFADGSSIVKVGNALFEGHEQGADPHREGSAMPTSKYIADVGYFADGTSMVRCGNALFREPMADPHTPGSALPDSEYVNSSGALADGTPMGKV